MAITSIYGTNTNNSYTIRKTRLIDEVGNLTSLEVDTIETDSLSSANVEYVSETYDKVRSKTFVSAVCDLSVFNFNDLIYETPFVFDGVELPINSRILCINDPTLVNNGIWQIQDNNGIFSLFRPSDYNVAGDVTGSDIFVAYGNTYANTLWVSTTDKILASTVIGNFPIYIKFVISTEQDYVKTTDITETAYSHVTTIIPPIVDITTIPINSKAKVKAITVTPNNVDTITTMSLETLDSTLIESSLIDTSINTDFVYNINNLNEIGAVLLNVQNSVLFTSGSITIKIDYTL